MANKYCPLLKRIVDCQLIGDRFSNSTYTIPYANISYGYISSDGGFPPAFSVKLVMIGGETITLSGYTSAAGANTVLDNVMSYSGTSTCRWHAINKEVDITKGTESNVGYCALEAIAKWDPYFKSIQIRSMKIEETATTADTSGADLGGNYP